MNTDSPPADRAPNAPVPIYGPEFARDPGRVYDRLRRLGPAAPVELAPGVEAVLVTGYTAALNVLRTPETFSKDTRRWRALNEGRIPADSQILPMIARPPNCLNTDDQEHERFRQSVADSLDRIDPHALRHYVERSADTLIDGFAPRGEADLLTEYAKILPVLVLNLLFGLGDSYGARLMTAMNNIFEGSDPETAQRSNTEFTQYLSELIAFKREKPGNDVVTWMMAHSANLTDTEMTDQLILLLAAGTEPMTNLIANSVRVLLSDERFADVLTGGSTTVTDALDEVLRTDPPMANFAVHYPKHDVMLEGVFLPEGEQLVISFAAANTDPSLAAGGESTGNRSHLAYSAGPHACPAQGSARLIASVAVERLLDRLPDIELATPVEQLAWRPGPFHRALATLPVRFAPFEPRTDQTPGEDPWTEQNAPSSSITQVATSKTTPPASVTPAQPHWWSFLAAWWHGQ